MRNIKEVKLYSYHGIHFIVCGVNNFLCSSFVSYILKMDNFNSNVA